MNPCFTDLNTHDWQINTFPNAIICSVFVFLNLYTVNTGMLFTALALEDANWIK